MGDELANLLKIFKRVEKDGGQATLSVSTNAGLKDHHQAGADLLSVETCAIFAKLFSFWRPAPPSSRPSKEGESQG